MSRKLTMTTISYLKKIRSKIRAFAHADCAAAAIEFAAIMPILILFYMGAAEILLAVDTSRKLNRVTANIGEMTAKFEVTTGAAVKDLFNLRTISLAPYAASRPNVTITALRTIPGLSDRAIVMWSLRASDDSSISPYEKGSIVPVNEKIGGRTPVILWVESDLAYKPILGVPFLGFQFPAYTMRKAYYTIPRYGTVGITCDDCL